MGIVVYRNGDGKGSARNRVGGAWEGNGGVRDVGSVVVAMAKDCVAVAGFVAIIDVVGVEVVGVGA